MSRRSRRLARRRHTHNRNTRARRNQTRSPQQATYSLFDIPPNLTLAAGGWVSPYYAAGIARREHLQRELAIADKMAALGFDMREEHDAITTDVVTLEHTKLHVRGAEITYAEIDGVRICITEYGWCEREFGHDGPHVYNPRERP